MEDNKDDIKLNQVADLKQSLLHSPIECEWQPLFNNFRHTYLFNYYPTTCQIQATQAEWDDRWTIWNFKNNPARNISVEDHQKALNRVIPMIEEKLTNTFGKDALKHLTLVCIPATSQEKTKSRYEEFSKKLCGDLGMINAYQYISVKKDTDEKKTGGSGLTMANIKVDFEFFKDKYVLLFDDVVTKGITMRNVSFIMKRLGAQVVGGLSIGRTKHERDTTQL